MWGWCGDSSLADRELHRLIRAKTGARGYSASKVLEVLDPHTLHGMSVEELLLVAENLESCPGIEAMSPSELLTTIKPKAFLAVAREKRPKTARMAFRRSVTARLPRPCLGAVGYQLALHGSLEKRRNESKLLDQQPANSYDGRWQMASTAGRSIHADRSIDSLRKIHRKITQNTG